MQYFIAYKQSEDTYAYVTSIGVNIGTTIFYGNALNFITHENAENVSKFLNKYDSKHDYIVITYEYSLREEI